ncbi:MAG: sugar phosphate isomerase/epimerase, partial [Flavobacteriaceae bacterium]
MKQNNAILQYSKVGIALLFVVTLFSCAEKKQEKKEEKSPQITQERLGGLALYTVRTDMGNDAKSTLKAVADAGYAYIEAAGYQNGKFYNLAPEEFKSLLQDLNLKAVSTHQGSVTMENADVMMADVKAAGFEYFVIPVPPMGLFKVDPETRRMGMEGGAANLAQILDKLGEKASKVGLKLLYHNHDFEFIADEEGVIP